MIGRSFASHVAVLVLLLGAGVPAPAAAATVTVLYFDNDSGDASFDHLGKGLADMMVTDLSSVAGLQVVERDKLQQVIGELKLQHGHLFDPSTASKIGRLVGAEYAITGSLNALRPSVRLDTRLIRIATGEVVKAAQVTGREADFFDLEKRLVAALIADLDGVLAGRAGAPPRAVPPPPARIIPVRAVADYGRGLDTGDRGDYRGASEALRQVVNATPEFDLARQRYLEFMKRIYAVKEARAQAAIEQQSAAERAMRDGIARTLAAPPPTADPDEEEPSAEQVAASVFGFYADRSRGAGDAVPLYQQVRTYLGHRVLRGLLLRREIRLGLGEPRERLLGRVRAYVENQIALAEEVARYRAADPGAPGLYDIPQGYPPNDAALVWMERRRRNQLERDQVLADLARFLFHWNTVDDERIEEEIKSHHQSMFNRRNRDVCFIKSLPDYLPMALRAFGIGNHADVGGVGFGERADALLSLGRIDDAVAELQTALDRHPNQVDYIEKKMKAILSGADRGYHCSPLAEPAPVTAAPGPATTAPGPDGSPGRPIIVRPDRDGVYSATIVVPRTADNRPAGEDLVAEASALFVRGEYGPARRKAHEAITAGAGARAWRVAGAAACMEHDRADALAAWNRLDNEGRQYVQYVCRRNGEGLP